MVMGGRGGVVDRGWVVGEGGQARGPPSRFGNLQEGTVGPGGAAQWPHPQHHFPVIRGRFVDTKLCWREDKKCKK